MANFCYYNQNPQYEHRQDCVTRAISLASGMSYTTIRKKLFNTAKLLDCEKLCVSCYKFFIENVLFSRIVNCDGMTVNEFADRHPVGTFLVRMEGHISTIIDNCVYDIFDCRNELLTSAWEIR